MNIIHDFKSPNYNNRPVGVTIDSLVFHYTETETRDAAIYLLTNPKMKVSAHYLLDEQGNIYNLVDDNYRAWHAGESFWRGRSGLNDNSIGIEIVNKGRDEEGNFIPYNNKQIAVLVDLSKTLIDKYNIPQNNILGHSDIAPYRKLDPGKRFPWKYLAKNNIGNSPDINFIKPDILLYTMGSNSANIVEVQNNLAQLGYNIEINSIFDEKMMKVIEAFTARYYQDYTEKAWSKNCEIILANLLNYVT